MFYNQSNSNINNYVSAQQMNSYIRVLHASPNAPAVDIYANGNLIVSDLSYSESSPYIPVPSDNHSIMVFPAGQMSDPVISTNIFIPPNSIFNVAAIGELPNISLLPIQEPTAAPDMGKACVRFVHLSPNAPAVDIKLADGTEVFTDVEFKEMTGYVCVPPGTYTFNVSPTGTNDVVLTVPNIALSSNNAYTIYAIGLVGASPALKALLIPEPR